MRNVIVTGSTRGIGFAIACAFAEEGAHVVINGKTEKNLIKASEYFSNMNYSFTPVLADVSSYEESKKLFNTCSHIDVLINNAGISHWGLFNDMQPDQWDLLINTNIKSVFNCTHHAISMMLQKQRGHIINISSIWGNSGASCEAVYSATKGAVNSFTKAIAKELGGSGGIYANAISCGVIETDMNQWLNEEESDDLKNRISLFRFGKTSEVAKVALFLGSENASYINGQIINVDGCFVN